MKTGIQLRSQAGAWERGGGIVFLMRYIEFSPLIYSFLKAELSANYVPKLELGNKEKGVKEQEVTILRSLDSIENLHCRPCSLERTCHE